MSGPLDFDEQPPRPEPEPEPPREPRPAPTSGRRRRYGWLVGVVVLAALAWIGLNTLRTQGVSSTGVEPGRGMPPFAVPLALGSLDGDANIAVRPDSGAAGSRPACEVRGPEVLNSCQLAERGPVVLAFLATRGGDCTRQLDRLETVRRSFPRVQVAGVSIRGDRGELRATIRKRGWDFPVGYDRDGVLANLYGVAVCPQLTYAYPGGKVRETVIGEESEAQLRDRFVRLVRASRERGWRPPTS